jgi:DNA-binding transcriptional ArsR family regulator
VADPAKRTQRNLRKIQGAGTEASKLDQLIHERARLGIVSALAANPVLSFQELRDLLGLTDGNLAVHARRLEEAGYVSCEKGFDGRVPRTEYRLAAPGRKALKEYLEHMESLIRSARREGPAKHGGRGA